MKKFFRRFLFAICVTIICSASYKISALKFKIFARNELGKTRITLVEINSIKSSDKVLSWSRLVDDKDILVLNDKIISIPASGRAVKVMKNLDQIDELPTSYIEKHYYKILACEERGNDVIYRYLRNCKAIKKFLGEGLKLGSAQKMHLNKIRKSK